MSTYRVSLSSARYVEREASTIAVGERVVLTGKDGQGTYSGLAEVIDVVPSSVRTVLLVTLWTGRRRIYRRWDRLWQIKVATPID